MASVTIHETTVSPNRRSLLKWTGALARATGISVATGHAKPKPCLPSRKLVPCARHFQLRAC
jgi:hypothetical protein